jgi:hypothetical protein
MPIGDASGSLFVRREIHMAAKLVLDPKALRHMRLGVVFVPVGALVSLFGLIWLLQGIGILPGSFMTGSQFWATTGAVAVIVGLIVIAVGVILRKRHR